MVAIFAKNAKHMVKVPTCMRGERRSGVDPKAAKAAAESYPPYNVEQLGDAAVRITLAVAGFTPEELSVTVEGRQLTITGKREDAGRDPQAFLHRGIAARGFVRSFVLADGLEIAGARLEHGLLHVDLIRPEQERSVRRIPITTG